MILIPREADIPFNFTQTASTSNYINGSFSSSTATDNVVENVGSLLTIPTIILITITFVVVSSRMYSRAVLLGFVGADDYSILAATAAAVGLTVNACLSVNYGVGKHARDVPILNFIDITKVSQSITAYLSSLHIPDIVHNQPRVYQSFSQPSPPANISYRQNHQTHMDNLRNHYGSNHIHADGLYIPMHTHSLRMGKNEPDVGCEGNMCRICPTAVLYTRSQYCDGLGVVVAAFEINYAGAITKAPEMGFVYRFSVGLLGPGGIYREAYHTCSNAGVKTHSGGSIMEEWCQYKRLVYR